MSEQLDATAAALVTSKAAGYGGSLMGATAAWFGSIDLGFWISVLIAIGGFLMNWHFARKKDKRDELESKAYLKSLEDKCNVKD